MSAVVAQLPDGTVLGPTMPAGDFARLLGVSTWAVYEGHRRGDLPVPAIRVGRRLVWPTRPVLALLGLEPESP